MVWEFLSTSFVYLFLVVYLQLAFCVLKTSLKNKSFLSLLNYSHIEVQSGAAHDAIEKEEIKHIYIYIYLSVESGGCGYV
jgi:hypothetical protein